MSAQPNLLAFPEPVGDLMLVEKYRPRSLAEFCGIAKPKEALLRFAEHPKASNWLFSGEPGTGKTTAALALAEMIHAEVQHIASNDLTVQRINEVHSRSFNMPLLGHKHWLNLIDEVDTGSKQALDSLLSKLDTTEKAPNTIWILTCNDPQALHPRLRSRCMPLEFSNYGIQKDAVELLQAVWDRETNGKPAPNLARIVKEANGNIRAALMALELEILVS